MSIWGKAKAKVEELYGRAEEIYGESHGDAAAEVRGEAHVIDAEAEEGETAEAAAEEEHLGHGPASERWDAPEDDVSR
jgi:uncharacterized protein YjbJ (UPF0337 family)